MPPSPASRRARTRSASGFASERRDMSAPRRRSALDPGGGATIVPLRRTDEPRPTPVSDTSDETLLAACATGDSAALGTLFDRHHEAVYRLISRLLQRDPDEIDDLVQTTFLAAWRSAARYHG